MSNILIAFLLTLLAGLSTTIGSLIAFFAKKTNKKFLSVALGFSAGVMLYVSFVEILNNAKTSLSAVLGEKWGTLVALLCFFEGMVIIMILDKLLPQKNISASPRSMADKHAVVITDIITNTTETKTRNKNLLRTGILTAIVIAIHNFPEGLATFVSALHDPTLAIPIVVAIAIHNIPEGIAISVPVYHATGSKKKAFLLSFLSGFSEPLGAIIGYLILLPIMTEVTFGILFAIVAGIMVFISLDELLPTARKYGEHRKSIYGLIMGMLVMALSLWLFI